MKRILLGIIVCFFSQQLFSQLTLDADGEGDTYELISSKLAPGSNPIEVPDCNHSEFGRHIDEVFDDELNAFVFRFHLHTNEDDDRCINFDRQRNEIKSFGGSPDSLLAVEGERFVFKWKFKLDENFQSSSRFTHLHQLKAVGGSESSQPIITFTTRDGSPDQLELRYAETTRQETLTRIDLTPLKGNWCDVTETVLFGENGSYEVQINRLSDSETLFSYSNDNIRMWKTDADFVRPKWGIYRSIEDIEKLRDEQVLYANFSIEENPKLTSSTNRNEDSDLLQIFPNPTNQDLNIANLENGLPFEIYSLNGKIARSGITANKKIELSGLLNGIYVLNIKTKEGIFVKRFVKE